MSAHFIIIKFVMLTANFAFVMFEIHALIFFFFFHVWANVLAAVCAFLRAAVAHFMFLHEIP